MHRIIVRLAREPVLLTGAIRAVAMLSIALGLDLTTEQIAAAIVAVESALSLINRELVSPA